MFHLVRMGRILGLLAGMGLGSGLAWSQDIWRCGNDYTNQPDPQKKCNPVASSTVTVIEGTRVQQSGATMAPVSATSPSVRAQVSPAEQQHRDQRARQILQAELDRAHRQQRGLRQQWQLADESEKIRLRPLLERVDADVAALQREMAP
jgi:hypothetical protein